MGYGAPDATALTEALLEDVDSTLLSNRQRGFTLGRISTLNLGAVTFRS